MPSEQLTRDNFNDAIYDHDIVIIEFFRTGDPERDEFEEMLDICSQANRDMFFASCDLEQVPEAAKAFSVVSTPTLAVFRDQVLLIKEPCARRSDPLRDPRQMELLLAKIRALGVGQLAPSNEGDEVTKAGEGAGEAAAGRYSLFDVKVGLTCNNACRHCVMSPVKQAKEDSGSRLDATHEEVIAALDRARDQGCRVVTLTGGEPTVRDDFAELVRHAVSLGLSVTVQTNGRLLSRKDRVKGLAQIPTGRVRFVMALHGSSAKVHDQITRRAKSFDQTLAGIENLKELGYAFHGKLVISRLNVADLRASVELMVSLGAAGIIVAFPHAEGFTPEAFDEVVPRYTELREPITEMLSAVAGKPRLLRFETIPYCVVAQPTFWAASLDRTFTLERQRGRRTQIEMLMDATKTDWTNRRPSSKSKGADCQHCLLDRLCEGPWSEYVEHYGSGEFTPIEDAELVDQFLAGA